MRNWRRRRRNFWLRMSRPRDFGGIWRTQRRICERRGHRHVRRSAPKCPTLCHHGCSWAQRVVGLNNHQPRNSWDIKPVAYAACHIQTQGTRITTRGRIDSTPKSMGLTVQVVLAIAATRGFVRHQKVCMKKPQSAAVVDSGIERINHETSAME